MLFSDAIGNYSVMLWQEQVTIWWNDDDVRLAIIQLCYDKNKLLFDEMMMMSTFYLYTDRTIQLAMSYQPVT
jgi:hypothetical protein